MLAVVITAGTVVMAGPTTAQAAEVDVGSVEVMALPLAIAYTCPCTSGGGASSSGSISGAADLGAFTVAWAAPPVGTTNLSQSLTYNPTCDEGLGDGAVIDGSSVTISGALLTYNGTANMPASVTLDFFGQLVDGAMVPRTTEVDVVGGGYTITITSIGIPGSMTAVPTNSPVGCTGTKTFTASGQFLTLGGV